MISSRLGTKSEGSAIWNGGKFLKILGTRVFRILESEGREDERVPEFKVEVESSSPTVAIQSKLRGLMINSLNFTCRDFNAQLKQYAVFLKLGQPFKLPAGKIPSMSRHKIACHDILNFRWDKSSLGYDSKCFLYVF